MVRTDAEAANRDQVLGFGEDAGGELGFGTDAQHVDISKGEGISAEFMGKM